MKKSKQKSGKVLEIMILCFVLSLAAIIAVNKVYAINPQGASVTYVTNSTKGASIPENRSDQKGYIHTANYLRYN